MPSYRLKGRRVVVRAELPADKIGSIYIPDRAKQQPLVGEVVLVGDKVTEVSVGDRVMFPSIAWSRFNAEGYGFPHMLLKEEDLLCALDDDKMRCNECGRVVDPEGHRWECRL